jgi:molybdopterin-containing oxidoreductase family iron-sulfur binding subunit
MEKCTFCVQRIRNAEQQAKISGKTLQDGEILTACQQTCPTGAIVFGDLNDKNSHVRKLMENTRRYQLLHELNTKPAVIYLKKISVQV